MELTFNSRRNPGSVVIYNNASKIPVAAIFKMAKDTPNGFFKKGDYCVLPLDGSEPLGKELQALAPATEYRDLKKKIIEVAAKH